MPCQPARRRVRRAAALRCALGPGLRAGALLGLLALASACGVPRTGATTVDRSDYATLPNLKRAEEALQDRIAREQEHVEALNQRVATLRADEDRLHGQAMLAEADYQLRQGDLDGVRADLDRVRAELSQAQADLAQAQTDLTAAHQELGRLQAEARAILEEVAQLRLLIAHGQVALDSLPPEVRAFLAEAPPPAPPPAAAGAPAASAPSTPPATPAETPPAASGETKDGESAANGDGEPAKP
jgi:septal ring factor EnvC (AmiA/AmiB activator)